MQPWSSRAWHILEEEQGDLREIYFYYQYLVFNKVTLKGSRSASPFDRERTQLQKAETDWGHLVKLALESHSPDHPGHSLLFLGCCVDPD